MAGRYCRLNRIDFRARQKAVAHRIHNQRGNRRTQGALTSAFRYTSILICNQMFV